MQSKINRHDIITLALNVLAFALIGVLLALGF